MKFFQKSSIIFLAVAVLTLFACKKETVIMPTANTTVQTLLNQIETNFKSGGVVASTRTADGTIDNGVLGIAQDNLPITAEMSMGIGSNTKTFTATLIFKLIEEGKLNLTDKLSDILPNVVRDNVNGTITIQQLLTHSSGIYDPLNSDDSVINGVFENSSKGYTLTGYLALLKEPAFAPGAKHSYSNTNYILLGTIIEQQTGRTYSEYLRATILDPLNMTNTFMMGYESPTNAIAYSWYEGNSLKDFDRTGIESLAWSAGSIFSTVKGNELYFHTGQTVAYNSVVMFNKTTGDIVIVMVNQIENEADAIAFRLLDSLLL